MDRYEYMKISLYIIPKKLSPDTTFANSPLMGGCTWRFKKACQD